MTLAVLPSVLVERSHAAWRALGASLWLVRQLRFGLQLPWTQEEPYWRQRTYLLSRKDSLSAQTEVEWWLIKRFVRSATES